MTIRHRFGALPANQPTGLDLPPAVWARLRAQYDGVFDERQLRAHVRSHLGDAVATELVDEVLRHAPGAHRVLDVACGFGTFVRAARRAGLDAIGIDLAAPELAFARDALAGDGVGGSFVLADAGATPIAPMSVDAVTMWNVLEHVPDRRSLIVEAHRVLRPGGVLLIEAPNYAAFRGEAHYHVPWAPFVRGRLASWWLEVLGRNPRFFDQEVFPCTARAVVQELEAAGFDVTPVVNDKLHRPDAIRGARARRIAGVVRALHLVAVTDRILQLGARSPLRSTIRVVARAAPIT